MNFQESIQALESTGDFRVIERLKAVDEFNPDDGSQKINLMLADCESTGLDHLTDKIMEIGYVIVEYGVETGKFYKVLTRNNELQDPGIPISEEISKLTGIVQEDVNGKSFDRQRISKDIEMADWVYAHNSGFDRKMMEVEFPELKEKPWGCSLVNGPWKELGYSTAKLDYLCIVQGNFFYQAHRALTDCEAMLKLMNTKGMDGHSIMKNVHDKSQDETYTVWATNAPFESKDILKLDGKYRWNGEESEGKPKAWYKSGVTDLDAEIDFLQSNVYPRNSSVLVDLYLPEQAFSTRYTERQKVGIEPKRKSSARP